MVGQEPGVWVDGIPWGYGMVQIVAVFYMGSLEGHSPQAIAYASFHFGRDRIQENGHFHGIANMLCVTPDGLDFAALGFATPIAFIYKPQITRSN